ncbi:helix-turn-helix domain-containing protein [Lewinella sp. W8]|uniref:helix-turn-helix domain-containing protein n=1 Tax=Lewinella sp. W8 TaxID=2528208 RepID=UPI0010677E4A|nr:helix-turn-helix transcriptional regulator [Lewinella sp. W8]MTB53922.1 helix-turn-helix domain-containing protein [Lewinella sp. W8]
MNIPSKIKEIREKKGISQAALAEASGLSATYISQVESGKKSPTLKSLQKLSDAIGVPFPILSFLALEESDVAPQKRSAYKILAPAVNELIQEVFAIDVE